MVAASELWIVQMPARFIRRSFRRFSDDEKGGRHLVAPIHLPNIAASIRAAWQSVLWGGMKAVMCPCGCSMWKVRH